MTQLDRIEAKVDSIGQMLFDLIQQLASDDEENAAHENHAFSLFRLY